MPTMKGKKIYYYRMGWVDDPFDRLSHGQDQGQIFDNTRGNTIPVHPSMVNLIQGLWGDFAYDQVMFENLNDNGRWWSLQEGLQLYDWNDEIINYLRDRCAVWEEVDQDVFFFSWGFTFHSWVRPPAP